MNIWEKRFRRRERINAPWPNEKLVVEAQLDFEEATTIWLRDLSERQQRRYQAVTTALTHYNYLNTRFYFAIGYTMGEQAARNSENGPEHPKTADAES